MSTEAQNGPPAVAGRSPVRMGDRGIVLADMDGLVRFASAVAKSGMAPKGMERPEAIAIAVQMGLELGFSPMSALQNIAVINGRPGIYGDAALALVSDSGLLEDFEEWYEASGKRLDSVPAQVPDDFTAACLSKRKGRSKPVVTRFGMADAKRANLAGKDLYKSYPQRMLKFRARGFNLRDNFPDVLRGFRTVEELQDYSETKQSQAGGVQAQLQAAVSKTERLVHRLEAPAEPTIDAQQAEKLADVLREEGLDLDSFLDHFGVKVLNRLPASRLNDALAYLQGAAKQGE